MKPTIKYISDESITDPLDREIRCLFTTCFTKPQDTVFKHQRFFREPYPHRWVIRDENHALIAHIGVHEKQADAEGKRYCVGGIAEVCVHPDHRGKGYVRMLLNCVHAWLSEQDFSFAVLLGDPLVYGSSGYVQVNNVTLGTGKQKWKPVQVMIREISNTSWPAGEVHLPGPAF